MDAAASTAPSIIARWRIPAGEVQVNQALALVCNDPRVAHALLEALLTVQSQSPSYGERATRLRAALPSDVRCREQSWLPEYRRRGVLSRWANAGLVDLDFSSPSHPDFRFYAELKFDAKPGTDKHRVDQHDRYLHSGHVIAIARTSDAFGEPDQQHAERWLGTVTWAEIETTLCNLPVKPDALRTEWMALLKAMDRDGDFEARKPPVPMTVKEAAAWLDNNSAGLVGALADAIRRARATALIVQR